MFEVMTMDMKYVQTTCPYCGTGCSFNLVVKDGKVVDTAPYHRSPVNEGKLCPKGTYAHEFVNREDRLTTPLIKKDGKFVEATWEEANALIAEKFKGYTLITVPVSATHLPSQDLQHHSAPVL